MVCLRPPLCLTHCTGVLIFHVLRIRFNVEDIASGRIGLASAARIRTRDRIQMRQRGVQTGVLVQGRSLLLRGTLSAERRLQNERLLGCFRGHLL